MLRYRIYSNAIVAGEECERLGWPLQGEHFVMPDDAFEKKKFIIYKTVFGIGDWGILTAMPRLLKEAYPDCEVYIPSAKLLLETFGPSNRHGSWMNPYDVPKELFKNNPYVDGIVDNWDGEIYHDHFAIYNEEDSFDPLILQMLRFHRVDASTAMDYIPEVYFSQEEVMEFNNIKQQYFGDGEYIAFSASWSHKMLQTIRPTANEQTATIKINLLKDLLRAQDGWDTLPALVFNSTGIDFGLNEKMSAHGVPLRQMLYLISNAKYAIGQQTGMFDTCSRYTKVKVVPHGNDMSIHYLKSIDYTKIPFTY